MSETIEAREAMPPSRFRVKRDGVHLRGDVLRLHLGQGRSPQDLLPANGGVCLVNRIHVTRCFLAYAVRGFQEPVRVVGHAESRPSLSYLGGRGARWQAELLERIRVPGHPARINRARCYDK